ncbi:MULTISPECIES: SLAC1 anion channel family protein [unclassified Sulfurospirillum]|uniref:SLAC1 anion channel family protein n=1 Tax=unclassified Sulfurospirillum TaxID=2618290 RepID=UPI000504684B|nr:MULTISPECIES: SLAC1 anion channel family protein [unclassified Sulfurospirillum]KFL34302.1 C4-dicarboxylate ABC transporter [Sulfurospirillum sp. SCADC]
MKMVQEAERNRLKFFPIMMYATVMGMSGLTIMYQKAALWLGFSALIGEGLMAITTLLFGVISVIYITKFLKYSVAVKKEFSHPVRINFFAAVSISMLMLAIIYKEHYPSVSAFFWYPGAVLHFYLTMHTISFWINNNQELDHSNPAWFIPIVGNVLIPVAGVGFASQGVLLYFFSTGIFFWVILFAILLNRIIFHHQMANKFMPTMFILIAPPAVGFIAYVKIYEVIDTFAMILFNLALFFTFLIAFMYKNFIKIKFFISWWAFVFPVAAMAISTMLMYHQTQDFPLLVLAYTMIAVTSVIITIVIYQTLIHMQKGDICVQE